MLIRDGRKYSSRNTIADVSEASAYVHRWQHHHGNRGWSIKPTALKFVLQGEMVGRVDDVWFEKEDREGVGGERQRRKLEKKKNWDRERERQQLETERAGVLSWRS